MYRGAWLSPRPRLLRSSTSANPDSPQRKSNSRRLWLELTVGEGDRLLCAHQSLTTVPRKQRVFIRDSNESSEHAHPGRLEEGFMPSIPVGLCALPSCTGAAQSLCSPDVFG